MKGKQNPKNHKPHQSSQQMLNFLQEKGEDNIFNILFRILLNFLFKNQILSQFSLKLNQRQIKWEKSYWTQ